MIEYNEKNRNEEKDLSSNLYIFTRKNRITYFRKYLYDLCERRTHYNHNIEELDITDQIELMEKIIYQITDEIKLFNNFKLEYHNNLDIRNHITYITRVDENTLLEFLPICKKYRSIYDYNNTSFINYIKRLNRENKLPMDYDIYTDLNKIVTPLMEEIFPDKIPTMERLLDIFLLAYRIHKEENVKNKVIESGKIDLYDFLNYYFISSKKDFKEKCKKKKYDLTHPFTIYTSKQLDIFNRFEYIPYKFSDIYIAFYKFGAVEYIEKYRDKIIEYYKKEENKWKLKLK